MSQGKSVIRSNCHEEKMSLGKRVLGKKITGKNVNRKKCHQATDNWEIKLPDKGQLLNRLQCSGLRQLPKQV